MEIAREGCVNYEFQFLIWSIVIIATALTKIQRETPFVRGNDNFILDLMNLKCQTFCIRDFLLSEVKIRFKVN